jgi:hypothetical protein
MKAAADPRRLSLTKSFDTDRLFLQPISAAHWIPRQSGTDPFSIDQQRLFWRLAASNQITSAHWRYPSTLRKTYL